MYILMRDEKEGRKKQTRSNKQHSTPKAVTFSNKNELPQVGLEPATLYTLDLLVTQHQTHAHRTSDISPGKEAVFLCV